MGGFFGTILSSIPGLLGGGTAGGIGGGIAGGISGLLGMIGRGQPGQTQMPPGNSIPWLNEQQASDYRFTKDKNIF